MPVTKYDRKNKKFFVVEPKLIHVGSIKINKNISDKLTYNDKKKIKDFVEKIIYFGREFGAEKILSFHKHNIFKISEEFNYNEKKFDNNDQNKIKSNRKEKGIDIIKKQLGIT